MDEAGGTPSEAERFDYDAVVWLPRRNARPILAVTGILTLAVIAVGTLANLPQRAS